jgi:tetratricopeptide (TPR) repeat protein
VSLLTATLIVRDEERLLGPCLDSLIGIVDEIVVVDTGSDDASADIAAARGARVIAYEWEEDFAAARNVGLDAARGNWVLYVDADERLRPIDGSLVARRLEAAHETAFRIGLRPFVHATPYLEYRLWRADPEIRFRGVIHEQVVDSIHRVAARDGRPISDWPGLQLDHLGYEGDQARKHRRNLPLLRRRLEVDPANIFSWRHLARVLDATGDAEGAEEALEQAVALARREREPSSDGSLAWGDLVRLRHDRGAPVDELLAEGLGRWPQNWQLVWIEGNVLLDRDRPNDAAKCFRRLLQADTSALAGAGIAYDERIFGSFAQSSLGLALFRAERYAEAAEAYAAAARLEPDNPEHETKRILAAARARSGG